MDARRMGRLGAVGALVVLLLIGIGPTAAVAPAGAAGVPCSTRAVDGTPAPPGGDADEGCTPSTSSGPLAQTGTGLGALGALALTLAAVGFVLTGERRRPRRRSTDPRTRDRIASLIDRTP